MRLSVPPCGRFLAAVGLATTLSLTSLPTLAAPHAHEHAQVPTTAADAAQARQQATNHTRALMDLQKQWDKAQRADKSRALKQLIAKATARRQYLSELAQSNPDAVLRALVPESRQQGMPDEVLGLLEQNLELEGELTSVYEDYPDGKHRMRHFLETPFGERMEIKFGARHPALQAGKQLRIKGWLLAQGREDSDATLLVESAEADIQWLDAEGSSTTVDSASTLPLEYTQGEQRTLLMLVNFYDKPEQPWTIEEARTTVFGTVGDYIRENSDGRTWLSGEVSGWHTLELSSTVCDSFEIRSKGLAAAEASGIDTSLYQRFIYAFPKNACGFAGSGQVGGSPTHTLINDALNLHTVAHELGHNLGLEHARAQECGADSVGDSCSDIVYGDTFDVLGRSDALGHLNPFHKERLGWLDSTEIIEITGSGSFALSPYSDTATPGLKTLKVVKPGESGSWYYIEYRQPTGFDALAFDGGFVDADNAANGVMMRTAAPDTNISRLLDMTPSSNTFGSYDWKDAALEYGQSFYDAGNGLTVTTSLTTDTEATVDVQFDGGTSCVSATPHIEVQAPTSQWASAGSTVDYSISITNRDGAQCAERIFSLESSIPDGWISEFTAANLTLAPGETATTDLGVTSPPEEAEGFYDISVNTATSNSAIATYVVDAPSSNSPPTARDDLVQLESKSPVTIDALANDEDSDGDSLTVVHFEQGSKGSVTLNSDGTFRYEPARNFKSGDQFSYTVSDGIDTATATVWIELTDSSSGSDSESSGGGNGSGKGKK